MPSNKALERASQAWCSEATENIVLQEQLAYAFADILDEEWSTSRQQRTETQPRVRFEKELSGLINRHCIENDVDMPDFLLARMICQMLAAMGPVIKDTLDWHGCDSVCHPKDSPQCN